MKKFFFISMVVFLIAGFTSCTMEKRHYRNGYYFDRTSREHTVQDGNAPRKESFVEQASDTTAAVTEFPVKPDTVAIASAEAVKSDSIAATTRLEQTIQEVAEHLYQKFPSKHESIPSPIEKDKSQAVGAGIAAAIFFILGMLGLIIKGTAPPVGIFIGAAFVCFLFCVILASFLYPRDPVVKQPKEESTKEKRRLTAAAGGVFAIALIGAVIAVGIALAIFTSLFGWLL